MNIELNGLDPLSLLTKDRAGSGEEISQVLSEAAKGTVSNILKSYTGFFDILCEPIQNSLDSTQKKYLDEGDSYTPKIWIEISIRDKFVRVVDNGQGMDHEQFCYCLTPNVSFKKGQNLRGNKGVGATFLAYGFNYIALQSKKNEISNSVILRGGRLWVEDSLGNMERPKFQVAKFDVPELVSEQSGTCVEIRLSGHGGEKPKKLDWHGATNAKQWFDILRVVTPVGGIYLKSEAFKPTIFLSVTDAAGLTTNHHSSNAEFYYPHDIPNLKVQDLSTIKKAILKIGGDHKHIKEKMLPAYKNLECIYDIWDTDSLLSPESGLGLMFDSIEESLIRMHKLTAYAAHLDSRKTFLKFNESLGLREGIEFLHGGLLIASDSMPQGEMLIIPLKRYIGYQRNTFVIVHLSQGNPDLGRKVFQPEIKNLSEKISEKLTNHLLKYREYVKQDTGSIPTLLPNKALHDWKRDQENWRDSKPSGFDIISKGLTYISIPREEQDVVAVYNQLIGAQVIKGIRFFSTTHHDRYDALIEYFYDDKSVFFNNEVCKLGIRNDLDLPYQSEPKVLEYKFDFDSILDDFDKEIKFYNHIDFVVCWKASGKYKEQLSLKPLLPAYEGNIREFYGSTHQAFMPGRETPVFEVCVLEELFQYLFDPEKAIADQLSKYHLDF